MMGADELPKVFKRCHLIPATYEDAWRIVQVPEGSVFGRTMDFRRSQVSQVSTGSCSKSDALINQSGSVSELPDESSSFVTSWLVTA